MSSFRQDFYFGVNPRSRGIRLAPHTGALARVVFHPDIGASLEDSMLMSFLAALAERLEVACLASDSSQPHENREQLRLLLETVDAHWSQRLPMVLLGHGFGGALVLSLADTECIRGVVSLAPDISVFAALPNTPSRIKAASLPLLAVLPRHERSEAIDSLLNHYEQRTIVSLPGDRDAALSSTVAALVSEWSCSVARL
jgi:pimeloyl-ACP methyl ester carboxylesterase